MQLVKLKDFQVETGKALCELARHLRVTGDLSDPGIGKTWLAAFLAQHLHNLGEIKCVAVVCPAGVRSDWKKVLHAHSVPTLFIESWDRLAQGGSPWFSTAEQSDSGHPCWHLDGDKLLILDEVHKGKSKTSLRSKLITAAKKVLPLGVRVHFMSGTVGESPLDFYALGWLLDFHARSNFEKWCREYGCEDGFIGLEYRRSSGGIGEIHKLLKRNCVRLRKADVPGFPEKIFSVELLPDDSGSAERAMLQVISSTPQRDSKPTKMEIMAMATKIRHAVEDAKAPLVVNMALEELEVGRSALIFLNYNSSFDLAAALLTGRGIGFSKIRGGMSDAERDIEIHQFQTNAARVILVNTQAGGTGINLQDLTGTAPRISLMLPTHRVIDMRQGMDRTHRAGAESAAIIRMLFVDMGPEKRMHSAIRAKLNNIDEINDGDFTEAYDVFLEKEMRKSAENRVEFHIGKLPPGFDL